MKQSKYTEAEIFFPKALVINAKVFGADSLSVAQNLDNLANLYYEQDSLNEAMPL